jgi:hypothetical protein
MESARISSSSGRVRPRELYNQQRSADRRATAAAQGEGAGTDRNSDLRKKAAAAAAREIYSRGTWIYSSRQESR